MKRSYQIFGVVFAAIAVWLAKDAFSAALAASLFFSLVSNVED